MTGDRRSTTTRLARGRPLVAAAVAMVLAAACSGGGTRGDSTDAGPTTGAAGAPTTATAGATGTTATTGSSTTAAPAPGGTTPTSGPAGTAPEGDPGSLPQTNQRPSSSDPLFQEHTRLLWDAIVKDDPSIARPFFFPKGAYLQVKQIADPAKDYENRLIRSFEEDIHALHRQLAGSLDKAQLVGIKVNEPNAAWIVPGVEYNKGSYWRVMYNQLQYTVNGKQQSAPVVSMISWRGQWYVVHLSSVR